MSGVIRVDKAELDKQTAKLAELISDDELKNYQQLFIEPAMTDSTGELAHFVSEMNSELNEIVFMFY
jgi:hypothetical protein